MEPEQAGSLGDDLLEIKDAKQSLVVAMVGLPFRGKSFIAYKLHRYLSWKCYNVRLFNVGHYVEDQHNKTEIKVPAYARGIRSEEDLSGGLDNALEHMTRFLTQEQGEAAILDGPNLSVTARAHIRQTWKASGVKGQLVWVECILNDEDLIHQRIMEQLPFQSVEKEEVIPLCRAQIAEAKKEYKELNSECMGPGEAYIKVVDQGRQIDTGGIRGYLLSKLVFFVMNLSQKNHPIFISRHGQSIANAHQKLGGDSSLTDRGAGYAARLGKWIAVQPEIREQNGKFDLWTSTLKRTLQTGRHVEAQNPGMAETMAWKNLMEIDAGMMDGLTYKEVNAVYPEEFQARKADKLNYRYPQGESYTDVIERLEAVIFELERINRPLLVIGHQAVLRCLYAYFFDLPNNKVPYISIPLHTVIKVSFDAYPGRYECKEERTLLDGVERSDHNTTLPASKL